MGSPADPFIGASHTGRPSDKYSPPRPEIGECCLVIPAGSGGGSVTDRGECCLGTRVGPDAGILPNGCGEQQQRTARCPDSPARTGRGTVPIASGDSGTPPDDGRQPMGHLSACRRSGSHASMVSPPKPRSTPLRHGRVSICGRAGSPLRRVVLRSRFSKGTLGEPSGSPHNTPQASLGRLCLSALDVFVAPSSASLPCVCRTHADAAPIVSHRPIACISDASRRRRVFFSSGSVAPRAHCGSARS